jgi:hypothetical protein
MHDVSRDDFASYLQEELRYLVDLKNEPVEISMRIEYVTQLKKLADTQ